MTQPINLITLQPLEAHYRKPKRSTEAALHALPGWLPTTTETVYLPDPDHPDKPNQRDWKQPDLLFTNRWQRETLRWSSGWCMVELKQVRPLPPTWKLTKGLTPLLDPETERPSLTSVSTKGKRIWAAQCEKCKKHTLGVSTYFLQHGRCLHCEVKAPATQGRNLFIAGNYPLGDHLFLLNAPNAQAAEAAAKEAGHAWVSPIYASRRGRKIPLPVPQAQPRRPNGAWPFKLDDVPPDWEKVSEVWQDEYGLACAWFKPWFEATHEPETPAAPLLPAVGFDDFM
jgi:hypothetical protein